VFFFLGQTFFFPTDLILLLLLSSSNHTHTQNKHETVSKLKQNSKNNPLFSLSLSLHPQSFPTLFFSPPHSPSPSLSSLSPKVLLLLSLYALTHPPTHPPGNFPAPLYVSSFLSGATKARKTRNWGPNSTGIFKGLSASSQLRDGEQKTLISSNPSPQNQPANARERERERAEESSYGGEKLFSSSSWESLSSLSAIARGLSRAPGEHGNGGQPVSATGYTRSHNGLDA